MTPMMLQYLEIKNENVNSLVFFRLGDFYELFFDDAIIASKELDIVLTGRDCGMSERAPMCGVPYHAAEGYIARLIEKGYKVAICEQVEDPKLTKTIVKREVIRVVTPGTMIDQSVLENSKNNYLACLYESDKTGFGLTFCDVSTGDFFGLCIEHQNQMQVIDELAKFNPKEIISNCSVALQTLINHATGVKTGKLDSVSCDFGNARSRLIIQFRVVNLAGFGLENEEAVICSGGALLDYLNYTKKSELTHISSFSLLNRSSFMAIDLSSRRNLELTESMHEKKKKGSLLSVLDYTKSSMGARLLRKAVNQPLLSREIIEKRLVAVEELKQKPLFREEAKELINIVMDIERIVSRIVYMTANARDLISLKNSFSAFPGLKNILFNMDCETYRDINSNFDEMKDIFSLISSKVMDEPPFSIREGGFIKDGVSQELDDFRSAKKNGTAWLMELETKARTESGIKNLKVKYNKVFGFFIEITNSNLSNVPEHFIRRQTLSNCERYVTEELKQIEEKILGAEDGINAVEYGIFCEILSIISGNSKRILQSAAAVAEFDLLCSLATAAERNLYIKPLMNDGGKIEIKNGRHPVIENMENINFVPNDTEFDEHSNRLLIITGPNMAGKSTYMRQVALIVLMAQIGSFVPADYADIGIVDRIFTRVGASDDIATGQSTFMVEMTEVANILNNATKNSLLILDEIGRGTSTFDGLSIAWSVLEYIANKITARTLFATHYHELTELENSIEGVKNYSVAVKEKNGDIVFLRKIVRGGTNDSYGIQVAKLAGLPQSVLLRAGEILSKLKTNELTNIPQSKTEDIEYELDYRPEMISNRKAVFNELFEIDMEAVSPKSAWDILNSITEKLKEE